MSRFITSFQKHFMMTIALIAMTLLISISQTASADHVQLFQVNVDLTLDQASSMKIADLDGDGAGDIVSTSFTGNSLFWWKNTAGNGTAWTRIDIDITLIGPSHIIVVDLDNDTDLDIVGTVLTDGKVFWWENMAGDATVWVRHNVDLTYPRAFTLAVVNIDGDTDLDIVASSSTSADVVWWENTLGDASTWVKHPLASSVTVARSIDFAAINSDAFPDLVVADFVENSLSWWENVSGDGSSWSEHIIDATFTGAFDLVVANLDGDSDPDVLALARTDDQIAWWENTSGDGSTWTKHDISGFFDSPHSIEAADFDNDGDLDVFGGGQFSDEFNWWENVNGDALTWKKHVIWSIADPTNGTTGDLNADGVPDFVTHNQFANITLAWINRVNCPSDLNFDGAVNTADLLKLLTSWGSCPVVPLPCVSDSDGSGVVNTADLLDLLVSWGACP